MFNYSTVEEAIAGLKLRGFTLVLNLNYDHLICDDLRGCLPISKFEVVETYRFPGAENKGEDIVYAIETTDEKLKGFLCIQYGVHSEDIDRNMMQKLSLIPLKR